jgi:hypothetical protein
MSPRTISRLWTLTGIVALALLLATAALAIRAEALAGAGYEATLSGTGGPVLVRDGPSGLDPIVTILPQNTAVFVTEALEAEGRIWVLVETEALEGWVPLEAVEVDTLGP